jgi:hypothetical protein
VRVFDRDSGGVDVDVVDEPDADPDTTRLMVNADVGLGALNVVHDPDELDRHGFRSDFDDFGGSVAEENNAACLDTGARAGG